MYFRVIFNYYLYIHSIAIIYFVSRILMAITSPECTLSTCLAVWAIHLIDLITTLAILARALRLMGQSNVTWYSGSKKVYSRTSLFILSNRDDDYSHVKCTVRVPTIFSSLLRDHFHPQFSIIVSLRKNFPHFLLSRINKHDRDLLYWQILNNYWMRCFWYRE